MGRKGGGYSVNSKDYKLLEEVGHGASATVYRAIYLPTNELIAVKSLDLDRCNSNLDDIRREAQTMSLIDHPNAIRAFCSFVVDHSLWVVMPFMAEGSCLHLMKIAYPDGLEESAICSILKETLKALEYFHRHGHIHRDVKAGNILLDTNGEVKLADFGVSACMFDTGDRRRARNTFVGTPCWMAPEVLQPGSGYNFKADIWSFGITALELAHGHAPFSKYPPMKVLLMTIQNAPPGLDYDRDKKFSKSFKEMVAMCLVKDQTKRPTAEKLLKHSFFKNAKPPELTVKKLLADLPPLWNRVKALELKDAAQLALKKLPSAAEVAKSQSEYQRGVSAWNFDVEDIKFQASMLQDDDENREMIEENRSVKVTANNKCSSTWGFDFEKPGSTKDKLSSTECLSNKEKCPEDDVVELNVEGQIREEINEPKPEQERPTSDKDIVQVKAKTPTGKIRQAQSGPLTPRAVLSHSTSERGRFFKRCENEAQPLSERAQLDIRRSPSLSGPLRLPNKASANSLSAPPIKSSGGYRDSLDDKSKASMVQIKGRFSVTSDNVDLVKGSPLRKSASVGNWIVESKQLPIGQSPMEIGNGTSSASVLIPHLQNLFEQTSIQQDLIVNLLNILQPAENADAPQNGKLPPIPRYSDNNGIAESVASERERLLLGRVSELQARMATLTHELTAEKLKSVQLQRRINSISGREGLKDTIEEDA